MESPEIDVKLTIAIADISDKSSLTVAGAGKLKQSRYEDVWPEDVHAAFMEAVALYPPMGKRRLKYYRVSTHENEHLSDANQAKSFGRCQLIQSYILEKTGKNRSRKQVSSHLQRLKKIHKDNPAMRPLFSERSYPPSEHYSVPQAIAISPQDIFANISLSTRHLKSDCDSTINLQNMDTSADSSSTITYASGALPFNDTSCDTAFDLSTNFHNQPSYFCPQDFLSPQQCQAGTLHPPDSDCLSEFQDPSLFKDAINGGFRVGSAFNTPAFSIVSMRRLASKLPMQGRQVDSGQPTHFSRTVHSPGFQPTHQWISQGGLTDNISCNSPLTGTTQAAQQMFHTPFHPLQLIPPEKQRLDPGLASDWMWPQNPDILLGPRDGTFSEVRFRHPSAIYQYNPTCPEMRVNSPGTPHCSPSESEVSRLHRGICYSYVATSPVTTSESGLKECAIDFPRQPAPKSSENPGSPLVIRPTPIYPMSYIHTKIPDNHAPAPSLPP